MTTSTKAPNHAAVTALGLRAFNARHTLRTLPGAIAQAAELARALIDEQHALAGTDEIPEHNTPLAVESLTICIQAAAQHLEARLYDVVGLGDDELSGNERVEASQ